MTTTCDLGPDSRSQVAPFAVEKAVHNIMFIKHHMKRQDEFDAVSTYFQERFELLDVFNARKNKFGCLIIKFH